MKSESWIAQGEGVLIGIRKDWKDTRVLRPGRVRLRECSARPEWCFVREGRGPGTVDHREIHDPVDHPGDVFPSSHRRIDRCREALLGGLEGR